MQQWLASDRRTSCEKAAARELAEVREALRFRLFHQRRSKTHVRMKASSGAGNLPIFFPDDAGKASVTRNFAEVYWK
jgi:hypothetical protein